MRNAYSIFRDETDSVELQLSKKFRDADDLHPHVQTLSISDVEACVALENAAFSENERCSREKVLWQGDFSCMSKASGKSQRLPCSRLRKIVRKMMPLQGFLHLNF